MAEGASVKLSDITHYFWEPGATSAIDCVHPITGLSLVNGETLEQIRERYPNAIITELDAILKAEADFFKQAPVEIDAEKWDYMLNVLPPVQWTNEHGAETFKMSEMTSGTITTIFCRIGNRYFEVVDDYWVSHDQVATACKELIDGHV